MQCKKSSQFWFLSLAISFVELMHQTTIAKLFQLRIADSVVGFVVLAISYEAEILLQVMVYFLQAFLLVDQREEPPGPGEHCGIVGVEEFLVEITNEDFHGLLRINIVLTAPTLQRTGFATNLILHLLARGISNVDVAPLALEPQKIECLVRTVDVHLGGISRESLPSRRCGD